MYIPCVDNIASVELLGFLPADNNPPTASRNVYFMVNKVLCVFYYKYRTSSTERAVCSIHCPALNG